MFRHIPGTDSMFQKEERMVSFLRKKLNRFILTCEMFGSFSPIYDKYTHPTGTLFSKWHVLGSEK